MADDVNENELRAFVRNQLAMGYETPDAVTQNVLEMQFETEATAAQQQLVLRLVEETADVMLTEQQSWSKTTDCDRLDAAFAKLESEGIVARANFTCCSNCGHTEIGAELDEASQRAPVSGYTFFHIQDTENAAAGESLFLAFGSTEGVEPASIAVATRVQSALEAEGLKVEWDGTATRRLEVNLKWQRRLHGVRPLKRGLLRNLFGRN